jgi:glycosyltransferase involved in cell wall biosynthesis
MYSGNHSAASPNTTLLQAALRLRDEPRFLFMFVGGGSGKREVDEAIAAERPANIVSLPYQPLERIKYSLSAADLHVITLGSDMPGIIHPCKIYGAMSIGRPILLIGPRRSHAGELIDRHQVGWQVEQGDVSRTVNLLKEVVGLSSEVRDQIGARARELVRDRFNKNHLCGIFCDTLERNVAVGRARETSPRLHVQTHADVAARDIA